MHDPATVDVAPRDTPGELIAQVAHPVDRERRRALLCHLVKSGDWRQVLVFTRTKHGANRLAELLSHEGIDADAIHGNKSQGARARALQRFKAGELRVLVATDIAARGLDIEGLPHVVNYDLPNIPEDYVHRIARTGGAGSNSEAVALVCGEERELLALIENLTGHQLEKKIVPGFEPGPGYESARFDPEQARGRAAGVQRAAQAEGQRGGNPQSSGPQRNKARPEGKRDGPRRTEGQRGEMRRDEPRRSGPPAKAHQVPYGYPPASAKPHADEFSDDEDIDSRIDGNRVDYPGGNANRGSGGVRKDFRNAQGRRPAATLQGPMTSRGQPVGNQNRPLEPHESRLHENATRPQNGQGGKRRNSVSLTGLPRDED